MKRNEKTLMLVVLGCLFLFIGTAVNTRSTQEAQPIQETPQETQPVREAPEPLSPASLEARRKADEIARRFGPDDTLETKEKIGKAFLDDLRTGVYDDREIAFCDEIVLRLEKNASPSIRAMVVEALARKASAQLYRRTRPGSHPGRAFQWQDHMAPMLATYDDIVRRFGEDPHPEVQAQVVKALIEKSERLREFAYIAAYDEIEQRFGKEPHAAVQAQIIDMRFKKADAYFKDKYHGVDGATAILDGIKQDFGSDPKVRLRIASAFLENRLYDHLVQRFRDDEDPGVQKNLALALFRKADELRGLGEIEAATATWEEIFQRFGGKSEILNAIANEFTWKAFNLRHQGETQAAIAVEEEILQRFGENPDLRDVVIITLVQKARYLEDARESLAVYDRIGRFATEKPEMRGYIAKAMIDKAEALSRENEIETALLFHDEIARRFGKDNALREIMIRALFSKADTLCRQGNVEAMLAIYDDIGRRFANDARVLDQIVFEMSKGGQYLQLSGNPDAAIILYDAIERRFGQSAQREIQLQIAEMLRWKSEAFVRQGDLAAALALSDEIARRFGGFKKESQLGPALALLHENIGKLENDDSFRLMVAQALYDKAIILGRQGDVAGESALYGKLLQHISVGGNNYRFVPGEELLARVYHNQARILETQGDFRGAIALYDKIIDAHLGSAPHQALLYKGMALERMGEHKAARAIFEEFGKYFGRKGQSVEERLAQAMLLEEWNPDAAIAAYEAIDHDAEGEPQALLRKGMTLERQGKTQAAIAVYEEIVQRFGTQIPDTIREVVQQAALARAVLQGKSKTARR